MMADENENAGDWQRLGPSWAPFDPHAVYEIGDLVSARAGDVSALWQKWLDGWALLAIEDAETGRFCAFTEPGRTGPPTVGAETGAALPQSADDLYVARINQLAEWIVVTGFADALELDLPEDLRGLRPGFLPPLARLVAALVYAARRARAHDSEVEPWQQ
jgi:hypothetical protein